MIWIDETNILYTISNKLTQASTPAEWLEAVSDYARQRGATSGVLLYVEHDTRGQPEYLETTAVWVRDGVKTSSVGSQLPIVDQGEPADHWLAHRERLLLFTDVQAEGTFRGAERDFFAGPAHRGVAILPLNIKGRWIGTLTFNWNEPVFFDESDQRIFTAIIQLAAPVIDSMRLYEKSRERAARAEHLLAVNMALSQATNDAEILTALALYADQDRPDSLTLSYLTLDETGQPVASTIMAVWRAAGPISTGDPRVNSTFDLSGSRLAEFWGLISIRSFSSKTLRRIPASTRPLKRSWRASVSVRRRCSLFTATDAGRGWPASNGTTRTPSPPKRSIFTAPWCRLCRRWSPAAGRISMRTKPGRSANCYTMPARVLTPPAPTRKLSRHWSV